MTDTDTFHPADLDALRTALQAGSVDALASLFDTYRESLHRMAHFRLDRRLLGRVDPDDVLQESFLAAHQRLDSFAKEEDASPYVWLRLVVGQTMIDIHRRHIGAKMRDAAREVSVRVGPRADSAVLSGILAAHLCAPSGNAPSRLAVEAEERALLEDALESMDDIDREVLVLRHFEQLSNREVGELLQLKDAAASNRYVRALRRLKAAIDKGAPK